MPSGFPPQPVYPLAIDNDNTLYLVYNTTETTLASDNQAWSDEIDIVPVESNRAEIWANNGFANINGELLYYDAVETDGNGKVNKLKRCARNLGGEHTYFNPAGTWIRGFVVAQHHDQLVNTINAVESFIGIENSPITSTLDYRIRHIAAQDPCMDDGNCPSVDFSYDITSQDACAGTLISYFLATTGNFTTFKLDFGDGTSTSSAQNGTHLYPPNVVIDPFVLIGNNSCQMVITAVQRTVDTQPKVTTQNLALEIPIPILPTIPNISVTPVSVVPTDINLPPLITPCNEFAGISLGSISTLIPSFISIVPSFISVIGLSTISLTVPSIPNISLIANLPSTISINPISVIVPDIPPIMVIPPNIPPITVDWSGGFPVGGIPINWGAPPTISTTISIECTKCCSQASPPAAFLGNVWDDDLPTLTADLNYDAVIPSEIQLLHDLPNSLTLSHDLPSEIYLKTVDLPSSIDLNITHNIPSNIELINSKNLISSISLDVSGLPKAISLQLSDPIPKEISLTGLKIPEVISIEHSIPSVISIDIPSSISLDFPQDGIPMRLINPEISVKLDLGRLVSEDGISSLQRFHIIPCN